MFSITIEHKKKNFGERVQEEMEAKLASMVATAVLTAVVSATTFIAAKAAGGMQFFYKGEKM